MDRRRFISTADFGYDGEESPLLAAFDAILVDIVTPIFAEVYPELEDIELSGIYDKEDNIVMFEVAGYAASPMRQNVYRDFDPIIEQFAGKKQQILNGVSWAIHPTMKEELLERYDLSVEQFLIKTVKVEVKPHLTASYLTNEAANNPGYAGETLFSVHVMFHLSIEDLSTLEPDGEEAVRLRYANLCAEKSLYSEDELRTWAIGLGVIGTEEMTKEELCHAVRRYYRWL